MLQTERTRQTPPYPYLELSRNHPCRYDENAVWECLACHTGERHRVSGPLAQLLERYPSRFGLWLIAAPTQPTQGRAADEHVS